jgi:hypothetical protein
MAVEVLLSLSCVLSNISRKPLCVTAVLSSNMNVYFDLFARGLRWFSDKVRFVTYHQQDNCIQERTGRRTKGNFHVTAGFEPVRFLPHLSFVGMALLRANILLFVTQSKPHASDFLPYCLCVAVRHSKVTVLLPLLIVQMTLWMIFLHPSNVTCA